MCECEGEENTVHFNESTDFDQIIEYYNSEFADLHEELTTEVLPTVDPEYTETEEFCEVAPPAVVAAAENGSDLIKFEKKHKAGWKGVRSCGKKDRAAKRNALFAKWVKEIKEQQAIKGNRFVQAGYRDYKHWGKNYTEPWPINKRHCRAKIEFRAYAVFAVKKP